MARDAGEETANRSDAREADPPAPPGRLDPPEPAWEADAALRLTVSTRSLKSFLLSLAADEWRLRAPRRTRDVEALAEATREAVKVMAAVRMGRDGPGRMDDGLNGFARMC